MFKLEEPKKTVRASEVESLLKEGEIKLKLILFRHGPKKYAAGEKDTPANYFDEQVEEGLEGLDIKSTTNVHVISSPAERAKKTAELVEGKSKPENTRLDLSKKVKGELEIIVKYQQKLEEKIRREQTDMDFDEPQADQELKNRIDSTILENIFDGTLDNLRQKLGLAETFSLTSEDFSQNLEKYTAGYLRHLNMLDANSENKPTSLNVTHSYPIMCFLKNNLKFIEGNEIITARNMRGRDFLNKVGGCVKEAGAISLDYIQSGDKKIIKVKGENFEGYIDYE